VACDLDDVLDALVQAKVERLVLDLPDSCASAADEPG
jgi:hypothetical protein